MMSRHDGVSCDACLKANFRGRRYKCLICYDYDLCASCHEARATTTRHTTEHPMQCILTLHDFEIFYGGEGVGSEQPQSLTCPFCGRLGFTELTLMEHTSAEHHDTSTEVVCPICASIPGGDPNHVTDDFNAHITFDHRGGGGGGTSMASAAPSRELDDSGGGGASSRHSAGVRRMQYPGRGGLGRAVPRRNLTFGSVGNGLFPSSRGESMDPIAELLSQLTGVRRSNASSRQLQQQWHGHSSDIERRPSRRVGASSGLSSTVRSTGSAANASSSQAPASANGNAASSANGNTTTGSSSSSGLLYGSVVTSGAASGATVEQARVVVEGSGPAVTLSGAADAGTAAAGAAVSQFLLSRLSEAEGEKESTEESEERCSFARELMLSMLSVQASVPTPDPVEPSSSSPTENDTTEANTSNSGEAKTSSTPSEATVTVDAATQTAAAPVPMYLPSKPSVHCPAPQAPQQQQPQLYKGARPAKLGPGSRTSNPTGAITKASSGSVNFSSLGSRGPGVTGGGRPQHGNGGGGGSTGGVSAGGGGANTLDGGVSGPGQSRRKMVRGSVESRTNEPPPPH